MGRTLKFLETLKINQLQKLLDKADKAFDERRYRDQILLCEKLLSKLSESKEHPSIYYKALFGIAVGYKSIGEIDKAKEILERAQQEYPSDPDEFYTNILSILSDIYMSKEDHVNAEKVLSELSNIKDQIGWPTDYEHAYNLANLAYIHRRKQDFSSALRLYERSLELVISTQGLNTLAYAQIAKNLVGIYRKTGNKILAKEYIVKVLEIYEQQVDENDIDLAEVLNVYGVIHLDLGEIAHVEIKLKKAMEICEIDLVQNWDLYSEVLNTLAALYERKGEYAPVEQLYLRSIQILKNTGRMGHTDYAQILNNLGAFYDTKADFNKAVELYKEAINIFMAQSELPVESYLATVNNLASNFVATGKYKEAEQLLTESVARYYIHFGGTHPEYALALYSAAQLHLDLGNLEKAGIEIEIATRIYETQIGKDSLDYAYAITLEALLSYRRGQYLEALKLNEEAMKITRSRLGESSIEYANLLNNQAMVHQALSNPVEAASLIQESIRITQLGLGTDHPFTLKSTLNLGMILIKLGQLEEAENLFTSITEEIERKFNLTHQLYYFSLFNSALLKILKGDLESAIELTNRLILAGKKQVGGIFPALSQSEKYKLMRNFDGLYDLVNTVSRLTCSDKNHRLYEWIMFRKSLVLAVTGNLNTFVIENGGEELAEKFLEWKNMVYKINRYQGLSQEKQLQNDLMHLSEEAEQLEKKFNDLSANIPGFLLVPDYNWGDVVKNLSDGEILIDFVKYCDLNGGDYEGDDYRYGAYVVTPGADNPIFVDLIKGMYLETEILPAYNSEFKRSKFENPQIHDRQEETEAVLFQTIFHPFIPYLDSVEKIYIVLDGDLHLLNFNAVKNPTTGKYLIEEYEISCLIHPSSLRKINKQNTPLKKAALFGYPDYNLVPNGVQTINPAVEQYYTSQPQLAQFRAHDGLHFSMLPGTLDEVELIEELLSLRNWEVTSYVEDKATEQNLRNIDSPGLLLIATHTYFPESQVKGKILPEMEGQERKIVTDHATTASLLMAGANSYLASNEEEKLLFEDDGLFSAIEASMLKLANTDLVILSACSSGAGSVMRGEGVFGLQRGFFSAGANSVLMSLWNVDDEITKELMAKFIKKYSRGVDKRKALREAQLELKKDHPDPFYWASFVLVER